MYKINVMGNSYEKKYFHAFSSSRIRFIYHDLYLNDFNYVSARIKSDRTHTYIIPSLNHARQKLKIQR